MKTLTFLMLVSLTLFATFSEAKTEEGLILYLSFDEGSGNVAKDLSGNGNNGKINGATWTDGKVGKALSFNGKDNFVEVPFKDMFNINDAITLAAWIKPNFPFDPVWRGIINARKSNYGPYLLQTAASSVGEIGFWIGGSWVWLQTRTSLTNDFWHLCGTYDKKEGGNMYLNGKLDMGNTNLVKGAIDPTPDEGIVIGHYYGLAGRWWDGIIDEVAIYNKALTEDEVNDLYLGKVKQKIASVSSKGKVTTTWGYLKAGY
jgi:hypothetical protein